VEVRKKPIFTTALIAGDMVLLDAIHKAGLLGKIDVVFIDTYFLFPETLDFLAEVEAHYGFKAKVYHAADCATQEEFYDKYGPDYWMVRGNRARTHCWKTCANPLCGCVCGPRCSCRRTLSSTTSSARWSPCSGR
jgi:3'-phosphoadenosine 5'-phosphosulfate sulfotransferase (PAPS reductase)/FAD synthetase